MTTVTVLVASHNVGTRSQVRLTLGDERFRLVEAADSDAAIRAVADAVPTVAILDRDLSGVGALALARTLRSRPETAGVRTLLLLPRGTGTPEHAPGVDAVMALPMSPFALLNRVHDLIGETSASDLP